MKFVLEDRRQKTTMADITNTVSIPENGGGGEIRPILFLEQNIRLLHECELLIEISVPRVTVWHHNAYFSCVSVRY